MKLTANHTVKEVLKIAQEKRVFLLTMGLPGCGKSTILSNIKSELMGIGHLITITGQDSFVEEHATKHGLTYNDAWKAMNQKSVKHLLRDVVNFAASVNDHIAIDQTHMGRKSRKTHIELVQPFNYFKICLNVDCDEKVRYDRLKSREQTGKSIPWGVMISMAKRYEAPSKDEGFDMIIDVQS